MYIFAALGCPVNYMYCGNGEHKFVAKTFMCDGYKDCRNGEDETNFVCGMYVAYINQISLLLAKC